MKYKAHVPYVQVVVGMITLVSRASNHHSDCEGRRSTERSVVMDQHGLTRADMVPILGTPSRVSEVLRGKKG